jgi:hypothetical protein
VAFALAVAVLGLTGARGAHADSIHNWTIRSSDPFGADVMPGTTRYRLYNETTGQVVVYGERKYGINLVWEEPDGQTNIRFARQSGSGALKYDEPVAIYVSGGGYLIYQERDYGINLGWSSSEVYQWRIRGGTAGTAVRVGGVLGLFNTHNDRYVVYGERSYGIDLVWQQGTGGPSSQATVAHAVRVGPFPSPGTAPCSSTITWRFTPVSLTGSSGTGTSFTVVRSYSVWPQQMGPGAWYCVYQTSTSGLRTGAWRIEAASPVWTATCQVSLSGGTNLVHFTQYRSSCVAGAGWP